MLTPQSSDILGTLNDLVVSLQSGIERNNNEDKVYAFTELNHCIDMFEDINLFFQLIIIIEEKIEDEGIKDKLFFKIFSRLSNVDVSKVQGTIRNYLSTTNVLFEGLTYDSSLKISKNIRQVLENIAKLLKN